VFVSLVKKASFLKPVPKIAPKLMQNNFKKIPTVIHGAMLKAVALVNQVT